MIDFSQYDFLNEEFKTEAINRYQHEEAWLIVFPSNVAISCNKNVIEHYDLNKVDSKMSVLIEEDQGYTCKLYSPGRYEFIIAEVCDGDRIIWVEIEKNL